LQVFKTHKPPLGTTANYANRVADGHRQPHGLLLLAMINSLVCGS
jgi:hypothetical protein